MRSAGEASFTFPPLTSCCAARFLTSRGLVSVHGPGVGAPWFTGLGGRNAAPSPPL